MEKGLINSAVGDEDGEAKGAQRARARGRQSIIGSWLLNYH